MGRSLVSIDIAIYAATKTISSFRESEICYESATNASENEFSFRLILIQNLDLIRLFQFEQKSFIKTFGRSRHSDQHFSSFCAFSLIGRAFTSVHLSSNDHELSVCALSKLSVAFPSKNGFTRSLGERRWGEAR